MNEFVIVLGNANFTECKSRVAVAVKYAKEKRPSKLVITGRLYLSLEEYAKELGYHW